MHESTPTVTLDPALTPFTSAPPRILQWGPKCEFFNLALIETNPPSPIEESKLMKDPRTLEVGKRSGPHAAEPMNCSAAFMLGIAGLRQVPFRRIERGTNGLYVLTIEWFRCLERWASPHESIPS